MKSRSPGDWPYDLLPSIAREWIPDLEISSISLANAMMNP
jgi:hypothetical protein